jgi:hypothetical protein
MQYLSLLLLLLLSPFATAEGLVLQSGSTAEYAKLEIASMPEYRAPAVGLGAAMSMPAIAEELRHEIGERLSLPFVESKPSYPRIISGPGPWAPLDYDWVLSYSSWFQNQMRRLGLRYRPDAWDCDKYSMAFCSFADIAAMRADPALQAPLVGRMVVYQKYGWGEIPAGGMHEVVLFRSSKGWRVYEPQTGSMCALQFYPNRNLVQVVYFD